MKISNNDGDLYTFNIYFDQLHSDALFEIDRTVRGIKRMHAWNQQPVHLLWAGNFNQHSPL
jgi:hypothetical protein